MAVSQLWQSKVLVVGDALQKLDLSKTAIVKELAELGWRTMGDNKRVLEANVAGG